MNLYCTACDFQTDDDDVMDAHIDTRAHQERRTKEIEHVSSADQVIERG